MLYPITERHLGWQVASFIISGEDFVLTPKYTVPMPYAITIHVRIELVHLGMMYHPQKARHSMVVMYMCKDLFWAVHWKWDFDIQKQQVGVKEYKFNKTVEKNCKILCTFRRIHKVVVFNNAVFLYNAFQHCETISLVKYPWSKVLCFIIISSFLAC